MNWLLARPRWAQESETTSWQGLTLHVARKGRKGRHFVVFRVARDPDHDVIEVLRLLHDSMDLQRHLPAVDESIELPRKASLTSADITGADSYRRAANRHHLARGLCTVRQGF